MVSQDGKHSKSPHPGHKVLIITPPLGIKKLENTGGGLGEWALLE
jgi:hypothetical protein